MTSHSEGQPMPIREDSFGVLDPAEAMVRNVLGAVVRPQPQDPDSQPDQDAVSPRRRPQFRPAERREVLDLTAAFVLEECPFGDVAIDGAGRFLLFRPSGLRAGTTEPVAADWVMIPEDGVAEFVRGVVYAARTRFPELELHLDGSGGDL